ncbi:DNA polymerase theta-like, partial [Teleopsis dalmanni]|uniref:DNA polymerase theta-like n=1 Tax=Teleopsis dalmanni TaxID=139649 RepID=UPI0018CE6F7C
SMPPADGLLLFAELKTARHCFVLESELHAVYLVTPYSVCYQLQDLDWLLYLDLWEHLTPAMKKVGELVGVKESFLVRAMRQQTKLDYKQMQIHKRFYTALALQELIEEIPIKQVAFKYKCTRGMLQGLQQISSTFAGIVTAFCNSLEFSTLSLILSQFKERLYFGIHRDLIDLMRLPDLNYKRARALYDAGLTSIVKLANADVFSVEKIMHNLLSFDSAKQHENENVYEAEQRNVLRNFYITGKSGITVADAAKLLVQEARRFVQYEIGVGTINWAQNTKNDLETDRIHMSYEEENLKVCNRKRKSSENLNTSQLKIAKSIESKEKHLIELCTELNDKPSTSAKAKETLHKINTLEKEIKETSGEKLMITSSGNNNKQTNNGDIVGKQFSELKLTNLIKESTNLIKESTINNKEELSKYEKTIDNKKYNLRTSEKKKPISVVNDGQIIKSIEIEPQTVTTISLSRLSPNLKKTQTTVNETGNKTVKDINEIQKSLALSQNSVTIPRRSLRNHLKETTKNMNDVSMTEESFELNRDIAEVLDTDKTNKDGISTNEIQNSLAHLQNSVTILRRSRRNHSKETTNNMNDVSMTDDSFELNTGIAELLDIDRGDNNDKDTNEIQKSLALSQNLVTIPRRSRRNHLKETTKNMNDVSMTDESFELNTGIAELLDIDKSNENGKNTNEIQKSLAHSQNSVTIPRRSRRNHSKETTKNMNDMLMTDESFELNTGIAEVLNIDSEKKDVQDKNEIQMGLTYSQNSATNPCRNRRNHSKGTTKNMNDMLMTDESFELNTGIAEVLDIDKSNIKIQNSVAHTHYLETRSHQNQRKHSTERTSNTAASTKAIMEQKTHMSDLLITDDSFQLNTGIAQMLDIKLTETNATPIVEEKETLNMNNDDEIPNSQLAENKELEKTPFRSRLIRTRRATFKESEINSGLETNNNVHNTENSTGVSIEISDPSIKGCLIMDPSHINATSVSNNATTSSSFECVKIVDICGNIQIFQSTFEELMTSKCFGFCLGLENILEKQKPVIGANAAINQDLTKEEVEATMDMANFQIDSACFLAGIAFCVSDNIIYYMNMQEKESNAAVTTKLKCQYLHMILKAKENTLLIFDAKEQLKTLRKLLPDLGEICAEFGDPKVANWLLQPDKTVTFKQMVHQFAPECTGLIGLCGNSGRGTKSYGLDKYNGISAKVRSSIEACCTIHILKEQIEKLKKIGNGSLHQFFLKTEMPLQLSLCNMETIGFPTSESELHMLIKKLLCLQRKLETTIYETHGRRFNLTSSSEVAKVLGLHLKSGKRITTSKQILEKIESPISKLIINYRKVNSIFTNNILPLSECVKNNRIFGESNTFTSTGRISMVEPNLQNVAKNFEVYTGEDSDNLEISCRRAFYPTDPKRWLISIDFCQLEMRILAHLSKDPALLEVMRTKKDIFTAIAASWYKVSDDNVTDQLRNDTKKICYGIVYGMGMCSLADSLKCTEEQANLLSREFHAAYPYIRTYAEKIVRFARINGYIETITGRRRYVENINSADIRAKT